MTATARAEAKTLDWRLWFPGVVAPVAYVVVDYLAGEYVLQFAPAALLALTMVGAVSLAISSSRGRGLAGLLTVGPMWMAGGVTLALGTPLVVMGSLPLLLSFLLVRVEWADLPMLAWSVLGLTPLWTGIAYLGRAHALTKAHATAYGPLQAGLVATAGAVTAALVVIAAQAMDSRFIDSQLAALGSRVSGTQRLALQALMAYPLCGRHRCRHLVCHRLLQKRAVPASLNAAFKETFGAPVRDVCGSPTRSLSWRSSRPRRNGGIEPTSSPATSRSPASSTTSWSVARSGR
jgi:hypothetical protein